MRNIRLPSRHGDYVQQPSSISNLVHDPLKGEAGEGESTQGTVTVRARTPKSMKRRRQPGIPWFPHRSGSRPCRHAFMTQMAARNMPKNQYKWKLFTLWMFALYGTLTRRETLGGLYEARAYVHDPNMSLFDRCVLRASCFTTKARSSRHEPLQPRMIFHGRFMPDEHKGEVWGERYRVKAAAFHSMTHS